MSVVDSSLPQASMAKKVYSVVQGRLAVRHGRGLQRWLVALCAASLLSVPLAFAKDPETKTPSDVARPQTDNDIEDLLQQVEQQISEGHTITPEGDNALVTWSHVLDLPTLRSPAARVALQAFAEHTRHRADSKQAAGDAVGASDFSVFSDQASKLLDRPAMEASLADPSSGDTPNLPKSDLATTPSDAGGAGLTDVPAQLEKNETAEATTAKSAGDDGKEAVNGAPNSAPPDGHASQPVGPSASTTMPAMTPAPVTPAAMTPAPVTPAPMTPMPVTPAPVELAYGNPGAAVTDAPAAVANAGDASKPVAPGGSTSMPAMTPAPMNLAHGEAPAAVSAAPPGAGAERRPESVAPRAITAMPSVPPIATERPASNEATAAFVSRGDAMIAIKDISAARKFYRYAANAGSARAATALGETYDPAFLSQLGAVGLKPNAAMAAEWYRKAMALGDRAADDRLQALAMGAVK